MTLRTGFAGIAVILTALGGAALADSHHGHGGQGDRNAGAGTHDMMRMHSRMMGDGSPTSMMGEGMMHGRMGGGMMHGGMGGGMSMMAPMRAMLDADGDGTVTPEEARDGLQALLAEYDTDGDGSLSLAEFETMHSAIIREAMVDRFQFLDDDGDGQVTATEIVKPADRMKKMHAMHERMMQGGEMMDATDQDMMDDEDGGMTGDD